MRWSDYCVIMVSGKVDVDSAIWLVSTGLELIVGA